MDRKAQLTIVLPVLGLLFAATLWGVFWFPLRWLSSFGISGVLATFIIYCGTLVFILPSLFTRYRDWFAQPGLLIGLVLSGGWTNTAFILALVEGEVVRVILLFYLSPIWATILARLILKERITRYAYVNLMIACVGALIMLWTPELGYPWPSSSADWLALSSGLAFAFSNLLTHMAVKCSYRTKTSAIWLGGVLIAGVALLFQQQPFANVDSMGILYGALIGIFMMSAMTYAVVFGITHMPVHRSAVILLFEIVAAAVSAYLLTDERMSVYEWVGGGVVILSAYLAARQQSSIENENKQHVTSH